MVNPHPLVGNPSLGESPQPDPFSEQHNLILPALIQVLSPLGIRFKFSILRHPQTREQNIGDSELPLLQPADLLFQPLKYRLWVRCQAQKSLDYQIIATLLAKTLHSLDLQGFQDAIVESSQSAFPDTASIDTHVANWRLRIDLISPAVRYQSWAQWGDVPSIVKLLNFALTPEEIQVRASLKNLTLQIFCTLKNSQAAKFPDKKIALDPIVRLLNELAPQGVQGATIYGMQSDAQAEDSSVWTHWLDLPALDDPKFSPTPMMLAAQGDEDALNFVLERLLNPDLEQYEVGGIRLVLMHHHQLLHVMSEATVCPIQSQVATTVINVMQQLGLPGIIGVRVYGRISGQIAPLWSEGVDLDRVPDRVPSEFPSVAPEHQFIPDLPGSKISLGQRIGKYLVSTGIWKPQINMDKTDRLFYQPRFRWQPSLLLLVVGLGLTTVNDLAIKFALANTNITTQSLATASQRSFNNPLLDRQLAQYQLRCLQHGVPDILIVGSSRALRGVNPEVLRRGLIDRGYANPKIYNFGINGATAQVVDLVLRKLLTPQQLPKMVIWADGSRAFNSGRSDRTYDAIIASEGYRQLGSMSGAKPSNSSSLLQAQSSVKNTYQEIDNQIDLKLAAISSAYHHRDRLKTWLQSKVPFAIHPHPANNDDTISNPDAPPNINDRSVDFDGFLAVKIQFDPNTYYQKYPKVTGDSDGDYANFQLLGSQDRALQQVTSLLSAHKIPLVFVNVPLTNLYLDKFRRRHEKNFKQYMNKWMNSRQLTFVDMDGFLKRQYDRFSDPSHLNQWGASDVSNYLVQTRLIPWQVLNTNHAIDR